MFVRNCFTVAAFALAFALCGGQAVAQDREGGLQVDPDSPSGREYAIPVEQARRNGASRERSGDARQRGAAPAFGEGIEDSGATTDSGATSDSASGQTRSGSGGSTLEPSPSGGSGTLPDAVQKAATASTGTNSDQLIAIAGIGGGVLLLGGAAGLALRRRNSS